MVPLMLVATASHAAFDRSSTGRTITWLRTPMRPLSLLYPQNVSLPRSISITPGSSAFIRGSKESSPHHSPTLRLDVVHVRVLSDLDRRHDAPDVHAVLDHGRVLAQRFDGELVPDGNVGHRLHLEVLVLVH